MYPVSLKLSGFKSFAEPTEIVFAKGMSALVGPNGCGKSNIVEALRWVMGESSARQLRGFEMDEMIFSGSSERPPFSRAEVTLTLENSKLVSLPLSEPSSAPPSASLSQTGPSSKAGSLLARLRDEQSIVLSRRIETGGGSTYRINGKEALARDVQTLCADFGLGANASAIIAQGRVAALVEAKPSERRQLIEEAAGVRGLYARRSEALAMMQNTQTTLARVDDRSQEIAKRLLSLNADEARAERYRSFSQQIRRWQAADFAREEDALQETARSIETRQKACEHTSAQERTALAKVEAALQEALEMMGLAEKSEQESAVRCQSLAQDAALLERSQKDSVERKKALLLRQSEQISLRFEQQRALEEVEGLWEEARGLLQAGGGSETETKKDDANSNSNSPNSNSNVNSEQARKKALSKLTQQLVTVEQSLTKFAASLSDFDRRAAIYAERLAASRSQKQQLEKELAKLGEKLQAKLGEKANQPEGGETSQNTATALQTLREEVLTAEAREEERQRKTLPRLRAQEEAVAQEREQGETRYRAHHLALTAERDKNRDLYREASESAGKDAGKAAGKATGEDKSDEGVPLVVDWNIPEGLAQALFGALGEDLFATLQKKQMKEASSWRTWKHLPLLEGDPPPLPMGAVSFAELFVNAPAPLRARLACIGLVEQPRDGEALQGTLLRGQRLVARDGSCWRWDGLVTGAELAAASEQRFRAFLQKEKRKEAWAKSEADLTQAQREHEQRLSEQAGQLLQIRNQTQAVLEEQSRQGKDLQILRKRLLDAETAAHEQEGYHARQTQLTFGLDDARAKELSAEQGLQELAAREQMVEEQSRLVSERDSLYDEQRRLLAQAQREEASQARAREEQQARVASEQRLRGLKERHRQLLQRSVESLHAIDKEAAALAERPLREQKELVEKHALHRRAEIEHRKQKNALEQASGRVARLREQHRLGNAKNAEAEKEVVRLQAQAEPLPLARQRLAVRALEEMDCSLENLRQRYDLDASFLSESPELQKAARRATADKRARLGEINFTAKQALKSLSEEHEQTKRQHADVVLALEKLTLSVRKLEEEASGKLLSVLEEAGARFAGFIERLFGGGEAKLFFSDPDDPIASGLEIRIALPGKRLKSLGVLSGGEQALVAIALVLAVFSVAGGGFCILDEVDAALDDANVARFCDMLEDIAQQYETRFLLITHHRHTMSRALQLYGVAMPEPGCSRIVSVALEEAVEHARTAAE